MESDTDKDELKAAASELTSMRTAYETGVRGAQTAAVEVRKGQRIAQDGLTGPTLFTWMVSANGQLFDVAGASAHVVRTTDEKKPVRLVVRTAQGAEYYHDQKAAEQRKAEEFARVVVQQSGYATENAPKRAEAVSDSVGAFNRAAIPSPGLLQAVERSALLRGEPMPQYQPREWSLDEIVGTKPNQLVKNLTEWMGGKSPTVRNSHLKRLALAGLLVVALGGCFAWGAKENSDKEKADAAAAESAAAASDSGSSASSAGDTDLLQSVREASIGVVDGCDASCRVITKVTVGFSTVHVYADVSLHDGQLVCEMTTFNAVGRGDKVAVHLNGASSPTWEGEAGQACSAA